jgi:hypothetical protein
VKHREASDLAGEEWRDGVCNIHGSIMPSVNEISGSIGVLSGFFRYSSAACIKFSYSAVRSDTVTVRPLSSAKTSA